MIYELIWQSIFPVELEVHFCVHSEVVKWNISHRKNISSNHLRNFLSKNGAFTKFLPKMRKSKFPKLPHYCVLRCFDFNQKFREIIHTHVWMRLVSHKYWMAKKFLNFYNVHCLNNSVWYSVSHLVVNMKYLLLRGIIFYSLSIFPWMDFF